MSLLLSYGYLPPQPRRASRQTHHQARINLDIAKRFALTAVGLPSYGVDDYFLSKEVDKLAANIDVFVNTGYLTATCMLVPAIITLLLFVLIPDVRRDHAAGEVILLFANYTFFMAGLYTREPLWAARDVSSTQKR